jgi:hypothetical protein
MLGVRGSQGRLEAPRVTSIHYAMQEFSVSSAVRRFRVRLERDKTCRKLTARAIATLHNEQT